MDELEAPRMDVIREAPITDVCETPITDVCEAPITDVSEAPITDVSEAPITDVCETPITDVSEAPIIDEHEAPTMDVVPLPSLKVGPYILTKEIGAGEDGIVFEGSHGITDDKVAVKVSKVKDSKEMDLRKISKTLLFLRHPHIITLYESLVSPKYVIDVMECTTSVSLHYYTYNNKFGQEEARRIFQQIISAVDYLHRKMIVHRDINLENVLMGEDLNIKLIDFSDAAVRTDGNLLRGMCGSPEFLAPEIYQEKPYIGTEADVWSCGILLIALLLKGVPENDEGLISVCADTLDNPGIQKLLKYSMVISLIKSMLYMDRRQRATLEDIKNHPWFKTDLPEYLFPKMWEVYSGWINFNALDEVHKKYGVSMQEVHMALLEKDQPNKFSIEYCLMMDNWHSEQTERNLYTKELYGNRSYPDYKPKSKKLSARIKKFFRGKKRRESVESSAEKTEGSSKAVTNDRRSWRNVSNAQEREPMELLRGLTFRRRTTIELIMEAVYFTLKKLDYEWKSVDTYHLIVRKRGDNPDTHVRMELQFYETDIYACPYPYVMCVSSLPTSEETGEPSVTKSYHKVMTFLEECSILIYQIDAVIQSSDFLGPSGTLRSFTYIHVIKE